MSDIDKNSLAWLGFSTLCRFFLMNEDQILSSWSPNLAEAWSLAAAAIASEAIRCDRKERSLAEVIAPKPKYGNFLEITRIMSGG